jgi:hypothetical protein
MPQGYCWTSLVLVAILGCTDPKRITSETAMWETARRQLAAENPDSDAAVILAGALKEAGSARPDEQAEILDRTLRQAEDARQFTPPLEAPLPEGWPKPSLPGLIRIKSYPAVRAAWVRGTAGNNGQFMTLFQHIQDRQIAMTGPVVMGYSAQKAPETAKPQTPDSMAFLYRRLDQDSKGRFGQVEVDDEGPMRVVSVGLTGSYRETNFQTAAAKLRDWLQAHNEWETAGPVRVLAYNSPFMFFWRKYSEVQIPVRAAAPQVRTPVPAGEAVPS